MALLEPISIPPPAPAPRPPAAQPRAPAAPQAPAPKDGAWPAPTPPQRAFFEVHGYLVVQDAIPDAVLDDLMHRSSRIREQRLAMDWSARSSRDDDQVLQSMLEMDWPDWTQAPFHQWTWAMASHLLGGPARLWSNQILDKPPLRGAASHWHQDGVLIGAGGGRMVSCWMPLHDVDVDSGCMHFVDGGHRDPLPTTPLTADVPCGYQACTVDPSRVVACPIPRGSVTFHHGLTPHMTQVNRSPRWRQVVIQRFFVGPFPDSGRH